MRIRWIVAVLLTSTAPGQEEPPPVESDRDAQVNALIRQLGDDSFARRELASGALTGIGEPALPQLRLAARRADNLEIATRARQLLPRIMLVACSSRTLGFRMAFLESGEFTMGSPTKERGRRDDEVPHRVRITRPFLLGIHEVTQADYHAVMKRQPSRFARTGAEAEKVRELDTTRFPVDSVTWFEAIAFCNALSRRDGLEPYYEIDPPPGTDATAAREVRIVGGLGYRLPTEAEWEYACRAGSDESFQVGGSGSRGNFQYHVSTGGYGSKVVSLGRPTDVGSYASNPWGLYDMHGNIGEWCWDWYGETSYRESPPEDPPGPRAGVHRVLRGGSWLVQESSCRSASRFWHVPGLGDGFTGFRVARNPSPDMVANR